MYTKLNKSYSESLVSFTYWEQEVDLVCLWKEILLNIAAIAPIAQ